MSTIKEQVDREVSRFESEINQRPNVLVLGRDAYAALKSELGLTDSNDILTHYLHLQLADPNVVQDPWLVSVTFSKQV